MLDLSELVYLDTQKTGSTFFSEFLAKYSQLDTLSFKKHSPVGPEQIVRKDVSFLIGVRQPSQYYVSLFRYGIDGRGEIYQQLKRAGKESLYRPTEESFVNFLAEVNNGNPHGLQTRRLSNIMAVNPDTLDNLLGGNHAMYKFESFIRCESMSADLARRQAEWPGFTRLAKLLEDGSALAQEQSQPPNSSHNLGHTGTVARLYRNQSHGQGFFPSLDFMDYLDSPSGPLAIAEKIIFRIYNNLNT